MVDKIPVKELFLGKVEDLGQELHWNELLHKQFLRLIQSISAISNTRYFEISLNSDIYNFHYVEQFSQSIQSLLSCFSSAISNIGMRISNKSYYSFQAFKY